MMSRITESLLGCTKPTQFTSDGYKVMVLYKSKLSECEVIFLYPKRGWSDEDTIWYEA